MDLSATGLAKAAASNGNTQSLAIASIGAGLAEIALAIGHIAENEDIRKTVVVLVDYILEWRKGTPYDPEIDNMLREIGVEL